MREECLKGNLSIFLKDNKSDIDTLLKKFTKWIDCNLKGDDYFYINKITTCNRKI